MRIAVAGGTGTIGRRIAAALRGQDHEVRTCSRHSPEYRIDLTTGAGLDAALEGCEVVIDASNGPPVPPSRSRQVLVEGSLRLLAAERRAGVRHHVCVSIVGIDDIPLGYYRVKVEQERVVEAGEVPWTIVRATQFHDLLGGLFAALAHAYLTPVAEVRIQPVDVEEAGDAVARFAVGVGGPQFKRVNVAGPEVQDLGSLARMWRDATGAHTLDVPIPLSLMGGLGRALRDGRLTCAAPDVRGTRTFADWLQASRP
jgi:uncharacterized protein YbjT (DUF2867 family)